MNNVNPAFNVELIKMSEIIRYLKSNKTPNKIMLFDMAKNIVWLKYNKTENPTITISYTGNKGEERKVDIHPNNEEYIKLKEILEQTTNIPKRNFNIGTINQKVKALIEEIKYQGELIIMIKTIEAKSEQKNGIKNDNFIPEVSSKNWVNNFISSIKITADKILQNKGENPVKYSNHDEYSGPSI